MGRRGNEDYILPLRLQHGKTGLDYSEDGREMTMREKRVLVSIDSGLYYRLELQEMVNGEWQSTGTIIYCHENQLETKLANLLR